MIKTSEEEKRRDLIFELMEEEWERRVKVVSSTGKLEPDDIMTFATLKLNREMGDLASEMGVLARDLGELKQNMVTKETLTQVLGVGLTIVTIVLSLVALLI